MFAPGTMRDLLLAGNRRTAAGTHEAGRDSISPGHVDTGPSPSLENPPLICSCHCDYVPVVVVMPVIARRLTSLDHGNLDGCLVRQIQWLRQRLIGPGENLTSLEMIIPKIGDGVPAFRQQDHQEITIAYGSPCSADVGKNPGRRRGEFELASFEAKVFD